MAVRQCEEALARLHRLNHTLLPADVPGLDAATPLLGQLQHCYLRPRGAARATHCADCTSLQLLVGVGGAAACPAFPVHMGFQITQAPAAFSLPVMRKRPFETHFQVTVSWRSSLPATLSACISAYAIGEEALVEIADWTPPPHEPAYGAAPGGPPPGGGARGAPMLGGRQERVVTLEWVGAGPPAQLQQQGGDGQGGQELAYRGQALCNFDQLCFANPSAMQPRWVVFSCPTCDGGLVYTLFRLPTIVMCRFGDQAERARRLLWGAAPAPADISELLTLHGFRHYVKREMQAAGLARKPTLEDLRRLAATAGFLVGPDGAVVRSSGDQECVESFRPWLAQQLSVIQLCREQYERSDPTVICGYGITREASDAMGSGRARAARPSAAPARAAAVAALRDQPCGAFLLRLTTSYTGLALSVVAGPDPAAPGGGEGGGGEGGGGEGEAGEAAVEHWQLLRQLVAELGLPELLARVADRLGFPLQLLDIHTGRLYPLDEAMGQGSQQQGQAPRRQRTRAAPAPCASPAGTAGSSDGAQPSNGARPSHCSGESAARMGPPPHQPRTHPPPLPADSPDAGVPGAPRSSPAAFVAQQQYQLANDIHVLQQLRAHVQLQQRQLEQQLQLQEQAQQAQLAGVQLQQRQLEQQLQLQEQAQQAQQAQLAGLTDMASLPHLVPLPAMAPLGGAAAASQAPGAAGVGPALLAAPWLHPQQLQLQEPPLARRYSGHRSASPVLATHTPSSVLQQLTMQRLLLSDANGPLLDAAEATAAAAAAAAAAATGGWPAPAPLPLLHSREVSCLPVQQGPPSWGGGLPWLVVAGGPPTAAPGAGALAGPAFGVPALGQDSDSCLMSLFADAEVAAGDKNL
eukprot:scaffold10.g2480.t1